MRNTFTIIHGGRKNSNLIRRNEGLEKYSNEIFFLSESKLLEPRTKSFKQFLCFPPTNVDKMSTLCILVSYVGGNKSPKTYKQQKFISLLNNRNLFSCLSGGHVCVLSHFSRGQIFVTPCALAHQTPLSMGFSRQEYWSGLPCPPPGESSRPRDRIRVSYVSCIGRWALYH